APPRGGEGTGRQGRHETGGEDGPIPGRAHGPDYPRKPGPRLAQGEDDGPAAVGGRRAFERGGGAGAAAGGRDNDAGGAADRARRTHAEGIRLSAPPLDEEPQRPV